MIDNAPVAATVLLALACADPMIQVDAVVYLPENRPPNQQELAQMAVTLRNQAQKKESFNIVNSAATDYRDD